MAERWPDRHGCLRLSESSGDDVVFAERTTTLDLEAVSRPTTPRKLTLPLVLTLVGLFVVPGWAQQRQHPRRQPPPRVAPQNPPSPVATAPQPDATGQDRSATQEVATTPPPGSVEALAAKLTMDRLELAAKEAAEDADLTEEQKRRVADRYAAATADLERAESLAQREREFGERIKDAAQRAANAHAELDRLDDSQPQQPAIDDVIGLERELAKQQDQLRKLKDAKLQLDEQATRRAARRNETRQRLAELDSEMAAAKQQASAAPVETDPSLVSQARQNAALCRLRVFVSEKPALEGELELYDAEAAVSLLQIKRSLNARQLGLLEQQVQLTTQALRQARRKDAGSAVADALRDEGQVPPSLRPIAEKTLLLAEENQQLTQEIQAIEINRQRVVTQLDDLKKQYNQTQTKVDSVGLPASVGAMLRKERADLPDSRALRLSARARRGLIEKAQLAIFDLDERSGSLADLDTAAAVALVELPAPVNHTEQNLAAAKRLLTARSEVLNTLYRSQSNYFDALVDASIKEEQLAQLSDEFRAYIEQRVLWIRSHPPLVQSLAKSDWMGEVETTLVSLDGPSLWRRMLQDAREHAIAYGVALLVAVVLLLVKPGLRKRIKENAEQARSRAYSHFTPSVTAIPYTLLSSLFGPFILGFLAWRLHGVQDHSPLAAALATGFGASALFLLPLGFFRRVFIVNGLADAHFDWSRHAADVLRTNLNWIGLTLVPLVFCIEVARKLQVPGSAGIVYRVLSLVTCGVVTVFVWRIFHPRRSMPRDYLRAHEGGWWERLQSVWFWGLVTYPVTLGVLIVLGYSYTVRELSWRGFVTVCSVGVLYVVHGLAMRLLLVQRRKMSISLARKRFDEYKKKHADEKAQREAVAKQGAGDGPTNTPPSVPDKNKVIIDLPGVSVTAGGVVIEEDPLADLRANTAQTRRLVNTFFVGVLIVMLWFTWRDVLPAFAFLERWPLWNSVSEVTETVTDESGVTQIRTHEVHDPVTIAELLLAMIIAIVGCIAARDLPGLLELTVLKRLPLENSVRYAITTLSRYALIFVALFVACRLIGLRWRQIQWMATALTFGLAFGLQEMFANFVAGVIILFEQPVRVGDIVTIDDVTGGVARIRMRATTIRNWDRKDYIVPNKDFITGRLLNWTLSDEVNRIVINVGVAYGTDTDKAKEILMRIAQDHPVVVDEPAPMATFEEFGASSLNLVLRCFIGMENMSQRLTVVDQLYTTIDQQFKQANIEIAFPQQDIHIRDVSSSALGTLK